MNIIENVQQGSATWLALRATCDTASEAPAAIGVSKYASRTDLMKQKATGLTEEVDSHKQSLFDKGHAAEAAARSIAEEIIGSDLYPVTATLEVDGLKLLASLDGATMDETEIWEHKLYSASLAAAVKACNLDPHYTAQMDQQLLVSGARRCLFMTSDGTKDNMEYCWYESSPEKFQALIAGWKQFRADLANFTPVEVLPAVTATPVTALPAVSVVVNGALAVTSNFDLFEAKMIEYIKGLPTSPSTDQEFADAESAVKILGDAEDALKAAVDSAVGQTASLDQVCRTGDMLRELARTTRLALEKLVKARKDSIRVEIASEAKATFDKNIAALNAALGKPYMPTIAADFAGVMKGKKTVASLRDAVSTEMARVKILAADHYQRIEANLKTLRELGKDHVFLFNDTATIVLKANDDLTALVKLRIAEHKAAEAAKEEAQRERIRQEELDRIAAEAKAAADAAALKAATPVPALPQALTDIMPTPVAVALGAQQTAPSIIQKVIPAPKGREPTPTLALGAISERLGFNVTSAFLATLGFEATTVKAAKLFHDSDFPLICRALIEHIETVCETA